MLEKQYKTVGILGEVDIAEQIFSCGDCQNENNQDVGCPWEQLLLAGPHLCNAILNDQMHCWPSNFEIILTSK